MKSIFLYIRSSNWLKNLLVFFPLIFGYKLFNFPYNFNVFIAFFIFMLASNAVYLINDAIDIEYDKFHPLKRFRPLASGKISRKEALGVSFILSVFSLFFAFLLNTGFGWILVIYFVLNYAYSTFFKKIIIIDVFCLASFFILRLFAGNVIAKVKLSAWLICMTIILSLILGFTKRSQESKMPNSNKISGYFYFAKYNSKFSKGIVIGLVVFLFLAYIYFAKNFVFLLVTLPFAFFGVLRYLYLLQIPGGYGDPVRIAAEDKIMQIDILIWILICIILIYK